MVLSQMQHIYTNKTGFFILKYEMNLFQEKLRTRHQIENLANDLHFFMGGIKQFSDDKYASDTKQHITQIKQSRSNYHIYHAPISQMKMEENMEK